MKTCIDEKNKYMEDNNSFECGTGEIEKREEDEYDIKKANELLEKYDKLDKKNVSPLVLTELEKLTTRIRDNLKSFTIGSFPYNFHKDINKLAIITHLKYKTTEIK